MNACSFRPVVASIFLVALLGCDERSLHIPPPLREDMIKSTMSTNEVRKLLGKPDHLWSDPDKGWEVWTYYEHEGNVYPGTQLGGLDVMFSGGKVREVNPIYVVTKEFGVNR